MIKTMANKISEKKTKSNNDKLPNGSLDFDEDDYLNNVFEGLIFLGDEKKDGSKPGK